MIDFFKNFSRQFYFSIFNMELIHLNLAPFGPDEQNNIETKQHYIKTEYIEKNQNLSIRSNLYNG